MSSSPSPIGIIDIGSNSIRFVVYDPPYGRQAPCLNEKAQCGLGRDLGKTGVLHPEGRENALQTLKKFKAMAEEMGLADIHAVGTAALRDAADGASFVQQVQKETGIVIRVIDGGEEARLCALGVLQNFPEAEGVIGDLGGGSLEFARVGGGQVHEVLSLPLGVFRVLSADDPRGFIRTHLDTLPRSFLKYPNFYTVGGTWRAMTYVYNKDNGLPYERLMGKSTKAGDMLSFARRMETITPAHLMDHYRIEDRRAALMPTAALLLAEVLEVLGAELVVTSTSGLRDGVLFTVVNGSSYQKRVSSQTS